MKRFSYSVMTLVLVVLVVGGVSLLNGRSQTITNGTETGSPFSFPDVPSFFSSKEGSMIFVGDIMLSRSVGIRMAKENDYTFPFLHAAAFLQDADITFANLENPVSTRGKNVGSIYSFRADPKTIEGLLFAGFDVVSIANNHLWDYGREAFLDTLSHLTQAGIDFVGGGNNIAEAERPVIRDVHGTRVAFLAYTEFLQSAVARETSAGISRWDPERMAAAIASAKQANDIVVVSLHWGEEYKTQHNQQQETIAKAAIDAGADLVIGHHPHVVQEVERYKEGWIAYSLGNFIFDQYFSEETMRGLVLKVRIKEGKVQSVEEYDSALSKEFQVRITAREI
ncbi:MAG: CapA family protein [Patescibacteria group bacterium]